MIPDDQCVYWHENGVRKKAWVSPDEMAVFRGRGPEIPSAQTFQQEIAQALPAQDVLLNTPFLAVVRSREAVSRPNIETILSRASARVPSRSISPVFYPQPGKNPATRMALTGETAVRFHRQPSPADHARLEKDYGLRLVQAISFVPHTYLYKADTPWQSLLRANELHESGLVEWATPNWYRTRATRFPDDSLSNDPLFGQQWHLQNSGQSGGTPGADANVTPVWDTFRGSHDQIIAIVDDGLEIGHEDLQANVIPGLSWDWVDNDADPSGLNTDRHGTAVAGVAAARGFNQIGVTGATPWAGLAGYRLLGAETDLNEAEAQTRNSDVVSIYNNSWGPWDDGQRLEGPGPLTRAAIIVGAETGRDGKGVIYVWAGGNGREYQDNSNYDGYANQRHVLAIAASTDQGVQASYSEPGANILVNAPSSGGQAKVTTTDRMGQPGYSSTNYTPTFGGTSSAAPLVAGVAALILQANPDLTWRDMRWILAHTAFQNDPGHEDWTLNNAGLPINHAYGFGRVDALAAVNMAETWPGLGKEMTIQAQVTANLPIPDNDPTGISSSLFIQDDFVVEFVDIYFSAADHPYWGDLEIELTSPGGTKSILAESHLSGRAHTYDNWRFGSTLHLGESSRGIWSLTVRDRMEKDTGTLQSWTLVLHGHEPYHLTVVREGQGAGSVSSVPAGIACPDVCRVGFAQQTELLLTAVPDQGSTFAGWGGACAFNGADPTCALMLSEYVEVTALFNPRLKARNLAGNFLTTTRVKPGDPLSFTLSGGNEPAVEKVLLRGVPVEGVLTGPDGQGVFTFQSEKRGIYTLNLVDPQTGFIGSLNVLVGGIVPEFFPLLLN